MKALCGPSLYDVIAVPASAKVTSLFLTIEQLGVGAATPESKKKPVHSMFDAQFEAHGIYVVSRCGDPSMYWGLPTVFDAVAKN